MAEAPGWIATNTSGANAAVTATKAAVAGSTHVVYSITASFAAAADLATLTLKDDTTTIGIFDVHAGENNSWVFPKGILITSGNKIDAVLGAGGSGVGHINIHGTTLQR